MCPVLVGDTGWREDPVEVMTGGDERMGSYIPNSESLGLRLMDFRWETMNGRERYNGGRLG